jgi:hypothetical protein
MKSLIEFILLSVLLLTCLSGFGSLINGANAAPDEEMEPLNPEWESSYHPPTGPGSGYDPRFEVDVSWDFGEAGRSGWGNATAEEMQMEVRIKNKT